ncbi:hypothetical protein Gohar_019981 [Gossypium harknessii]|uniref:Nudix hydrolase domain-containing protein n=4 Tax=Gossypium TaxID=3633 RepID=A0A7J9HXQ1_9ROSI|nr:hypothetical protein [Gossypium harknessii]
MAVLWRSFSLYSPFHLSVPPKPICSYSSPSSCTCSSSSSMEAPPQGYRRNVGICLINSSKKVFNLLPSVFLLWVLYYDEFIHLTLPFSSIPPIFVDFFCLETRHSQCLANASGFPFVVILFLSKLFGLRGGEGKMEKGLRGGEGKMEKGETLALFGSCFKNIKIYSNLHYMIFNDVQGGIDDNEDPKVAALRELKEETGVSSAEILAEVPYWLTYDFPPEVREKLKHQWGSDWKGQAQKWFLLKFTGKEEEINLLGDGSEKPEFGEWSWMTPEQIVEHAVDFKKPVYNKVLEVFTPYLH